MAVGAGGAAIAIAQPRVYENLYLLGYGRGNELEADQHGIFMRQARATIRKRRSLFFSGWIRSKKKKWRASISALLAGSPADARAFKAGARKWIDQVEAQQGSHPSLNYNRDKYLAMVARLPHGSRRSGASSKATSTSTAFSDCSWEFRPAGPWINTRSETPGRFCGAGSGSSRQSSAH